MNEDAAGCVDWTDWTDCSFFASPKEGASLNRELPSFWQGAWGNG